MEDHPFETKSPSSPRRSSISSWTISERSLSVSTTDCSSPMTLTCSPLDVTSTEDVEPPILPITYAALSLRDSPSFHPQFIPLLWHLSAQLWPLVNCETGQTHPDFPATMLAYNLLTSEQVDNLARHFHQVWPPVPASYNYPVRITPWIGTSEEHTIDLPTRVRRLGRFFGLQGCESPTEGNEEAMDVDSGNQENEQGNEGANMSEEEAELLQQMELEWHQALQRASAEESHRWNLK
ncbi:hypothetical protein N7457_005990 [Penicillium paradoxum]|uniref:uncharacterized protein n=1 Tax=Penicillium paradoxum TaxID=176176 RepID=UPI0025470AEE|nr:uncharacterized protein N7457_005990 [Penicillium paradoxum]KAJ5780830.1 hypothetical protein N7457_005990 [Penicillium paradoxum]